METNLEKSRIAFTDLLKLMDRNDLNDILNADDSNWRNKVVNAMMAYAVVTQSFPQYDISRLNVEACFLKAIYLAGYEHGKVNAVQLIINR